MKTALLTRFPAFFLAVAAALLPALRAADEEKPRPRATLQLQVDSAPIDHPPAPSYAGVFRKAAPSVVNISTTRKMRMRGEEFFNDPMFRRFFGVPDPGARRPQTVQSLGSGIILTPDGYILTNNHVVEGADEIQVALGEPPRERHYTAKVVGRDPRTDVAVIKIDATGLPAATLGDSGQLQVGDTVLAIGDPFGVGKTLTHGIVSATGRDIGMAEGDLEDFIQTDAPINPGNSGGALLDGAGRVVGVNSAILSGSGTSSGVGFAISINLARSVAEQLVSTGRIARGFLGVDLDPQDVSGDVAAQYGVSGGALVDDVEAGSPADKAGLKGDDVITKIDGKPIDGARLLRRTVSLMRPGSVITIEYVRDGKTATAQVKLAEAKQGGETGQSGSDQDQDVGVLNHVQVGDITAEVRRELDLPLEIHGAVILEVDPNSASASAGLQQGDVIVALNRKPVRDADEAVKLSTEIKGPKVLVRIWRDHHFHLVEVDESS